VKALCESDQISELLEEFSPARAIWVLRHYDDVANSMNVSFPRQIEFMRHLKVDRTIGGWRTRGMSDSTYEIVQAQMETEMTAATAAALQWFMRNRLFFDQKLEKRSDVLLVSYENLVQAPEATFQGITEFIGIRFIGRMTAKVHARSVKRRPTPEISNGTRMICEGLWRNFQQTLAERT
jgi:hypothetical protein